MADAASTVKIPISQELVGIIRAQYALPWHGVHGWPHWVRVRENGLRLAEVTGARPDVVELFAMLHDSRRRNEGRDPHHGRRASLFALGLAGSAFELEPGDLQLLLEACEGHTGHRTAGDVTVLTCWDADRLDLGRVGIRPSPERLCTAAAREPGMIEWAYRRGLG